MKQAAALFVSAIVLSGGWAQAEEKQLEPRIHSLSNDEVLRLLPQSPGEVIEVRGDEYEEFFGYLMKLPVTSEWQTVSLDNIGCTVKLPDQPIQPWSMRVLKHSDEVSLWVYPVFQGQLGVSEAVEIRIHRFSPEALREHITEKSAFISDYLSEEPIGVFQEWQGVTSHPALRLKEQTKWQTWYRKDVSCDNGDTLRITGRLHKYTVHATGESLFDRMDATTRRVIESVSPVYRSE